MIKLSALLLLIVGPALAGAPQEAPKLFTGGSGGPLRIVAVVK